MEFELMEFVLIGICVVAALLATGAAVFFGMQSNGRRGDIDRLQSEMQNESEQCKAAEAARDSLQAEVAQAQADKAAAVERAKEAERLRDENQQLRERAAKAEEQARSAQKQAEETKASLTEMRDKMSAEFKSLSQSALEESGKKLGQKFDEDSNKLLKPLLGSLKEDLEKFRGRVDAIHSREIEARTELKATIRRLQENTTQVGQSADDLARAFKSDKKMQGLWGEETLGRLLENSGLRKGSEYETQVGVKNEDGRQQFLDAVIYLPDNHHMIIDAKVSLSAYAESVNADDDAVRDKAMARHVQAVRAHIAELSGKHYQRAKGMVSPDFVMMFMPIEPAYIAAAAADPQLLLDASKERIIVCAPSTLLPIMKTTASLWKLERQNKNAEKIASQGANLYDKFCLFMESMAKIDSALGDADLALDKARKAYGTAYNRISEGKDNLIGQAKKLRALGVNPKKRLPSDKEDVASENSDEKEE